MHAACPAHPIRLGLIDVKIILTSITKTDRFEDIYEM
jgi:hypothetical protein